MTLIIAEKPSLARNIVAGIGKMSKFSGYYEGCGYIVTWAFGHLFSLCDIEDYTGGERHKWSMKNIPCFPEEFRFVLRKGKDGKTDEGVERQFGLIRSLCNREDVDKIVNAGDSDREGEIIIRLCISKSFEKANGIESSKRFFRLWLPDQTPETVARALSDMKSEDEYDKLADEGFARTYVDWLYGVNLTRYATLKSGVLLRVGRVIVPIVKAIYDRDISIRNFVPDTYYAPFSSVETKGVPVELTSKTKFDKNDFEKAKLFCQKYNEAGATVVGKKSKKDTLNPGKLYSLSKLQNVLGKKYKMAMDESLQIVQKLYESGYVTYPRTNSEYLATAEKDRIAKIIRAVSSLGYPVVMKDKKTIFDDSKIESHSALTPTGKIPKKESLSADEMKVYQTIFRRFAAVFCSNDCVVKKTEIKIRVGDFENFTLKGTVIVEAGWTKYDDYSTKDKLLPELEKGECVNICFVPKEKETSPPKHYTIETLNNYLKNPFREDKTAVGVSDTPEDDSEDYRAIFEGLELGTEATRTGIIENAIKSKYIELKKDVYRILPDGEYLVEALSNMHISMDKYKTSQLGRALKKVFHGDMSIEQCVLIAENEISEVFEHRDTPPETDTDSGFYGDVLGRCPLCGSDVIRGRYGYGCRDWKNCKFKLNGTICRRVISASNVRMLLETGRTSLISGFISKNGKSFNAALKLDGERVVFDFENNQGHAEKH